jgi:hypothetical protein
MKKIPFAMRTNQFNPEASVEIIITINARRIT